MRESRGGRVRERGGGRVRERKSDGEGRESGKGRGRRGERGERWELKAREDERGHREGGTDLYNNSEME